MSAIENPAWWQRGIIYQIYPRSFQDTTGNGIGDLQGVIDRLDYLNDGTENSMGVDAIWFSPIFPSPMADFGYDVADYCNIHPDFGTLETFDRLVAEARRRNIGIILDLVPNHTSDRHAWFLESRSSRDNPKRDWYIWRDPGPGGLPPNNWGSVFGGPAWTYDEQTGQYYLHQFLKEQPELNWRNPEVLAAMLDVLRFWFKRGVAGFRIDVIGMIVKDAALRDNPPNPAAPPDLSPHDLYARQLHVHNLDQPEVHDIIREFRRVAGEYGQTVLIGEVWFDDLAPWVRYYGEGGAGLHLPFNFGLLRLPWQAPAFRDFEDRLEAILPAFAWPCQVLGNHDIHRLATRYGARNARAAALLLLTLRGTPFLYYGDEIGMDVPDIPPEKWQDPPGILFGAAWNRDMARTPMQWDAGRYAGFSGVEPWLPVADDYPERNVAAQSADPRSLLNLYRRLVWLRRATPALYGGSYRPLDAGDERCYAYLRQAGGQRRLVAINFSDDELTVKLPGSDAGRIVLSTELDRVGTESMAALRLRPNEGVIAEV